MTRANMKKNDAENDLKDEKLNAEILLKNQNNSKIDISSNILVISPLSYSRSSQTELLKREVAVEDSTSKIFAEKSLV